MAPIDNLMNYLIRRALGVQVNAAEEKPKDHLEMNEMLRQSIQTVRGQKLKVNDDTKTDDMNDVIRKALQ